MSEHESSLLELIQRAKRKKTKSNREENKINPFIFYPEVPRIFSNLAKDSATDA
jgi:hypothetical protein